MKCMIYGQHNGNVIMEEESIGTLTKLNVRLEMIYMMLHILFIFIIMMYMILNMLLLEQVKANTH